MVEKLIPVHILVCTDATPAALPAALLLSLMSFPSGSQVTLLGLGLGNEATPELSLALERLQVILSKQYQVNQQTLPGKPLEVILRSATSGGYDLAAIGDPRVVHGELSARRWKTLAPYLNTHHLAHRLASQLGRPLLVGRGEQPQLRRALFCSSGEPSALHTLQTGARWLAGKDLHVNLLHVMSQVALATAPEGDELLDTAECAMQRSSREGKHLRQAVEVLRQAGLTGEILPRLRHGLVIDEILAEIREHEIDLLVVGAHRQPGMSTLMGLLLEDVARDLVDEAPCSVLVV